MAEALADSLAEVGMWPMKEYISNQKAIIVEYIVYHLIYKLCMGVGRIPGSISFMQWWYQDHTW